MGNSGDPGGRGSLTRRAVLAQGLAVAGAIVISAPHAAAAAGVLDTERASPDLVDEAVDLEIHPNRSTFAVGTVGGKAASFRGSLSGSTVKGSMLGTAFKAGITQRDQVPDGSNFVTTTKLSGVAGGVPTGLLGTFTVGSNFLFEYGAVTGKTAGKSVKVFALPNKNFDTSSAVTVAGQFGDTPFSLVADIPVGERGAITGTIGAKAVHFALTPSSGTNQTTRITGRYSGPLDLLALIVGAATYFGG